MSNTLTYELLKEMVIKEMQLSLSQFGIKETGASRQDFEDAFRRWKSTTERGKMEAENDWAAMSRGEEVFEWDYDDETNKSFQVSVRDKYYENWSDGDFVKLLDMIHKEWEKK